MGEDAGSVFVVRNVANLGADGVAELVKASCVNCAGRKIGDFGAFPAAAALEQGLRARLDVASGKRA